MYAIFKGVDKVSADDIKKLRGWKWLCATNVVRRPDHSIDCFKLIVVSDLPYENATHRGGTVDYKALSGGDPIYQSQLCNEYGSPGDKPLPEVIGDIKAYLNEKGITGWSVETYD